MDIPLSTLRWFSSYFGKARWLWVAAMVGTFISSATEPILPALMKPFLDKGLAPGAIPLWWIPAALLLLFAVRGLAGFVADFALAKITQDGLVRLRSDMFARTLDASLDLFRRESATALSNTLVFEVQNGASMLVNALSGLLKDSVSLVGLLAYLLYLDWKLTFIVFFIGPSVAWLIRSVARRMYSLARRTQVSTNELAYVVEENVLAARVVRLHGAQSGQLDRFNRRSQDLRRLALKASVAASTVTPLTHMVAALALSLVVCLALWQSAYGLTPGTVAAFVTAMLMLIAPIKRLSEAAGPISRGLAALQRARELVEHTPAEAGGGHRARRADGRLAFEAVKVRYRDDSAPALDGVDLVIQPGEQVALVGPSGSGKTTLANLVPRFVHPSGGRVLLDGVDIAEWDLGSLRQQIALVSQDVVMFNDTLAANVALGDDVDPGRLARCIQAANLDEVVAGLPEGLQTVLGHNAVSLSGGQRQRLAIARALYKDAPILILDEATSALDAASERLVQEALARLMAGRTTLVIAHRLSTVEHADRLVVLDAGRIVESGTHAELLAHGGIYANLHALHSGRERA